MAALVVRKLEDTLKLRLRIRAAQHGRSMEEEVRVILTNTLAVEPPPPNLAAAIRARKASVGGGVEIPLPEREPVREPPRF